MARVLFAVVKLLAVEVVGETMGEAVEHGEAATSMLALPGVACRLRVLSMEIGGSGSGRPLDSPPCTSRMPNSLPRRPIEHHSQSLQVE